MKFHMFTNQNGDQNKFPKGIVLLRECMVLNRQLSSDVNLVILYFECNLDGRARGPNAECGWNLAQAPGCNLSRTVLSFLIQGHKSYTQSFSA